MRIWEYMELEIRGWPNATAQMEYVDTTKSTVGRKNLLEAMNALGGKGWEAIQVETVQGQGAARVYLKRPRG